MLLSSAAKQAFTRVKVVIAAPATAINIYPAKPAPMHATPTAGHGIAPAVLLHSDATARTISSVYIQC